MSDANPVGSRAAPPHTPHMTLSRSPNAIALCGALALSMLAPAVARADGFWSQYDHNDNCVSIYSSTSTHNGWSGTLGAGGDPSHGVRSAEIRAAQTDCNPDAAWAQLDAGGGGLPGGDGIGGGPAKPHNCISDASSSVTRNGWAPTLGRGGDPSAQRRGAEIQYLQATCNDKGQNTAL